MRSGREKPGIESGDESRALHETRAGGRAQSSPPTCLRCHWRAGQKCAISERHYSDLSPTMTKLASKRLIQYRNRALIFQTDGTMHLPIRDSSVDRVISTYILDLLPEDDISAFLQEAHRVVKEDGKLCLVSLTTGTTLLSRVVSILWAATFRLRPTLVGGCCPIWLLPHLKGSWWDVEHQTVVVTWVVPSEVVIARKENRAIH